MAKTALFARAHPREVQIDEAYFYEADLNDHSILLPAREPEGTVAVLIPYDGQKFFGKQALADVGAAVTAAAKLGSDQTLRAQIGYLAFAGFEGTNLDETVLRGSGSNIVPLAVPVYGEGLAGTADLGDDRHLCRLAFPYRPSVPEPAPLTVSAWVADEKPARAGTDGQARAEPEEPAGAAGGQPGPGDLFLQALAIRFQVAVELPASLAAAEPALKRLALHWPRPTGYRNLCLSLFHPQAGASLYPLQYEREGQLVAWSGVPLAPRPGRKEQEERTRSFRTPEMILHLSAPDEFHEQERLRGELTVEFAAPLSGGEVRYFDARGRQTEVQVKGRTQLKLAFSVDLLDRFHRRRYAPNQHLQFPGVFLDELCLANIEALLRAEGYVLDAQERLAGAGPDDQVAYLLTFYRSEASSQLRLRLRLEGRAPLAAPARERPDRGGFATPPACGDLLISIRADLAQDHRPPVHALDDVHRLLKDWFQP